MTYAATPAALKRPDETPLSEKLTWTLSDAARATGLSARTFQNAIYRGELLPIRVGRRVLLSPAVVRSWLEAQQSLPAPNAPTASA